MPVIGLFYERVKHEYIYPKHFPYGVSLSDDSLRTAVRAAYDDIIMLIPGLNGRGNQDEDYYMAEWLKNNRSDYHPVASRGLSDLAEYIYNQIEGVRIVKTTKKKYHHGE